MSAQEGRFARFAFWLQESDGTRRSVPAPCIDMVISQPGSEEGRFEETFSHELGHVILRRPVGDLSKGPSGRMRLAMNVTEFPTASDEGCAEHIQPWVRDASANSYLATLRNSLSATDLDSLWISRIDGELRRLGIKRKPLCILEGSAGVSHRRPDRYGLFLDGETSTAFLEDELENGQQMMAS